MLHRYNVTVIIVVGLGTGTSEWGGAGADMNGSMTFFLSLGEKLQKMKTHSMRVMIWNLMSSMSNFMSMFSSLSRKKKSKVLNGMTSDATSINQLY